MTPFMSSLNMKRTDSFYTQDILFIGKLLQIKNNKVVIQITLGGRGEKEKERNGRQEGNDVAKEGERSTQDNHFDD